MAKPNLVMPSISPYLGGVSVTIKVAHGCNAQTLARERHLVGHEIGEEHDVAPVDTHPVVDHGVLDLVDDRRPGRLDAQRLLHLRVK